MVPTINSVKLARELPNAELSIFPDAGHGAIPISRHFFTQVPKAEFDLAWTLSPSFRDNPRIEENGMLKDYKFLEEAERRPVTVPIADSYTNAVVDAPPHR